MNETYLSFENYTTYTQKVTEAAEYIAKKIEKVPEIAVILGSGLGPLVGEIKNPQIIDYSEIPHFPMATVSGHAGCLVAGEVGGRYIIAMKGRFHYYEGHDVPYIVLPVRVFKMMGVKNLLVTNAAGGINKNFKSGTLMLIKDHIGFLAPSALRGRNLDEFGTRFPDMTEAYSRKLRDMAKDVAYGQGIDIHEGIYAYTKGPMYETPAEIRALEIMGADAVGMSTVPEVVTARHCQMNVLGISCITNMAAGILDQPLSHKEVMETARRVEKEFLSFVNGIITKWE